MYCDPITTAHAAYLRSRVYCESAVDDLLQTVRVQCWQQDVSDPALVTTIVKRRYVDYIRSRRETAQLPPSGVPQCDPDPSIRIDAERVLGFLRDRERSAADRLMSGETLNSSERGALYQARMRLSHRI